MIMFVHTEKASYSIPSQEASEWITYISQWRIQGRRLVGGLRLLPWAIFGRNISKNERIGSCWGGGGVGLRGGGCWRRPLDPPMYDI